MDITEIVPITAQLWRTPIGMRNLYLITGTCLLIIGLCTFLIQLYLWLAHQAWTPAPLSLFWDLVGIAGPLGESPLAGVFLLFGGWLTWEGVGRGKLD